MMDEQNEKLRDANLKIINLMKFIDFWSYCTRMGIDRCCPERKMEWIEQMKRLGATKT